MDIDKFFDDKIALENELNFFTSKKQVQRIEENKELVSSFMKKAKHNMEFYKLNKFQNKFNDWLIVILYYSLYHSALALITNKKYYSKNHYATILILISEYGISKEEANLINNLSINKEDAELYTNLKTDRHYASYQTNKIFSKNIVDSYEQQVLEFIQKAEEIISDDI